MQHFFFGGGGVLDRIVLRSHIATRKKEIAGVPDSNPDPLLCNPELNQYITTAQICFAILQTICFILQRMEV